MGIKGIYNEIGSGQRIALAKLAIETFANKGRPLRIAIDTSIWLFQIQAGKGGSNPALRTFYYRLLRLVSLSIQPLFVFDGPNKPPLKRNKHTGANVSSIPEFLAKSLLRHFGLPMHLAPGEAEAECAWLQKKGIVDVVLSEDVDTLMFGSGLTMRNWSPEGSLQSKTPSHVNLYNATDIKNGPSSLDRDGMILIAMMSGGDYLPEGIPRCGIKTACEAARAGFGSRLCSIPLSNTDKIQEWKASLCEELQKNTNKTFSMKHKSLVVPEDFPRLDVLSYYVRPCVSTDEVLTQLKDDIDWSVDLDILSLRQFAADAFDWTFLSGAKKFIRNLAPAILVRELIARAALTDDANDESFITAQEEGRLIKHIYSTRQHITTDQMPEIRVGIVAQDIVKLDLDSEQPDPAMSRPEEAFDEEELIPNTAFGEDDDIPASQARKAYEPCVMERIWVPELYLRVGVPLKFQDWQESFRNAKKYEAMKHARKQAAARARQGGMPKGALDRFAKVMKPGSGQPLSQQVAKEQQSLPTIHSPLFVVQENRPSQSEPPPCRTPPRPTSTIIDLLSSPIAPAVAPMNSNDGIHLEEPLITLPSSVTVRRIRPQLPRTAPSGGSGSALPIRSPSTPSSRKQAPSNVIEITSSPITPASRQKTLTDWLSPRQDVRSGSPTRQLSPRGQRKAASKKPSARPPNRATQDKVLQDVTSRNTIHNPTLPSLTEVETMDVTGKTLELPPPPQPGKRKCTVSLRESMNGAWSMVTDTSPSNNSKVKKTRQKRVQGWRVSEVETLDLTRC